MEGLPEKRAKDPNHAEITFSHVHTSKERSSHIDDAFNKEFEVEYVPSHGNKDSLRIFELSSPISSMRFGALFELSSPISSMRFGALFHEVSRSLKSR